MNIKFEMNRKFVDSKGNRNDFTFPIAINGDPIILVSNSQDGTRIASLGVDSSFNWQVTTSFGGESLTRTYINYGQAKEVFAKEVRDAVPNEVSEEWLQEAFK